MSGGDRPDLSELQPEDCCRNIGAFLSTSGNIKPGRSLAKAGRGLSSLTYPEQSLVIIIVIIVIIVNFTPAIQRASEVAQGNIWAFRRNVNQTATRCTI